MNRQFRLEPVCRHRVLLAGRHRKEAIMIEHEIAIPTKAGEVETFICHPERGGSWPAIIFYMDAPGIREELRDMVRRLATVGYYVILPNLYYRHGPGTVLDMSALAADSPERQRMFDLMTSLSSRMIMEDTESRLAVLDRQPEVRRGPFGCVGYCMSGPFVFTAAGTFPERFAAAASIYGVNLLTDAPRSPHLLAPRIKGEIYFACAETDHWAPLPMVEALRAYLAETGIEHEVEIYPEAEHGFAFPQRAAYRKAAAERHWERLFALFRRKL
jgi:carboxymethylenebutenolidase